MVAKTQRKLKSFTIAEVEQHNKVDDGWIMVYDKVYDVTGYINHHPGGKAIIERFVGRDATDEVRNMHADHVLEKVLPRFCIGTVSDKPEPNPVQKDFRKLYESFVERGYFKEAKEWYITYQVLMAILFVTSIGLVVFSKRDSMHIVSALCMAVFWHQMAFLGHDAGHMSVHVDRKKDFNFGLVIANFLTGISVGWWKATHNVHHAVPNSLHDDPDIAHLPVFAISDKMFPGVYNTYHKRVMDFDWLARNVFVPYQHYLYYPIMGLARFNLYLQGIIRIFKADKVERKSEEILGLIGFFTWMYLLLDQLNSTRMVIAWLLISHVVSGLLEVQITLSHFSRPVLEGKDYGGDFYTRNVIASLDVECSPWLDWLHGGLQFQTVHHLFPRLVRRNLRQARIDVMEMCKKHDLPYRAVSFYQANVEVIETLRHAAEKSQTWSPLIFEAFCAQG